MPSAEFFEQSPVDFGGIFDNALDRPDDWIAERLGAPLEAFADGLRDFGAELQSFFEDHVELFLSIPGIPETLEDDPYEAAELWLNYIDSFINESSRFDREDWLADVGIFDQDFDWDAWREAMGY